ncbi:dynein light chain [Acrasis kona]|uniref:Dynein axonemal light chain 1 n=1 Tax=Acrasis kona TaxID=1008807 RepID=A0AAW2YID1_9EUKA
MPPIAKMDGNMAQLKKCKQLSLSTNNIDKLGSLAGMDSLEILSLGRNGLTKLQNLDSVAGTLNQLWISYNNIDKLTGIDKLKKLKVLYMSNNNVSTWSEFERLKELPELQDLLFIGNPLERTARDQGGKEAWRLEVLKRLPNLKMLDGEPVTEKDFGDSGAPM